MTLIGVGGYAFSGKDTLADLLVERHGFYKTYMSKPLEQALLALDPLVPKQHSTRFGEEAIERYSEQHRALGYDRSKENPEVRRLLQRLGTEVGRNMFGESVWVDAMLRDVAGHERAVVTGIRFRNELEAIQDAGGTTVWVDRGLGPVNDHASDNTLRPMDFDDVVGNYGPLSDLAAVADLFVEGRC